MCSLTVESIIYTTKKKKKTIIKIIITYIHAVVYFLLAVLRVI